MVKSLNNPVLAIHTYLFVYYTIASSRYQSNIGLFMAYLSYLRVQLSILQGGVFTH